MDLIYIVNRRTRCVNYFVDKNLDAVKIKYVICNLFLITKNK